ncbi:MAG: hypothetical protein KGZ58_12620 [Ignavibacteriales bacterium]|nr:hypothetical protein [Ignavibacteriales bacterium]
MNEHRSAVEFDTTIDEHGAIHLPEILQSALNKGTKVSVRVISNVISKELKSKRVLESEIEQLMSLQLENREQVVKFLLTEGSLVGNKSFLKRAKSLLEK